MKKMKAKDILIPAVALFAICLVASILLGVTNSVTAKKIAENSAANAAASRSEVLSEVNGVKVASYSDDTVDEKSQLTYCTGLDENGNVLGYIFTSSAKGYGGDVSCMIGYDLDGKIIGFTVLDCSGETPGLGQNSKTESFMERFIGKSGELTVNKNSNDGQNIQAITAATITSTAVVKAVNAATQAFNEITGGASNG
ncbi:MAG: RnfABCDGE type electron transport complex subunit G [Acutalibacteraceae bacterium]